MPAQAGQPTDPATVALAQALRQPGDDKAVLDVTRMRGGVTWDARWAERPDRYAIVTGTIDQIGSRLLFRGYGVTPEARPIDAALVLPPVDDPAPQPWTLWSSHVHAR